MERAEARPSERVTAVANRRSLIRATLESALSLVRQGCRYCEKRADLPQCEGLAPNLPGSLNRCDARRGQSESLRPTDNRGRLPCASRWAHDLGPPGFSPAG